MEDNATISFKTSVVVAAAGNGERLMSHLPKQYIKVHGCPLVSYSLKAFEGFSWIDKIVVVADCLATMKEVVEDAGLKKCVVTKGGRTRHYSIYNGLNILIEDPPDIVIIHDGVRPVVPEDILIKVVKAAYSVGAAGAVRPLVSTIVIPDQSMRMVESLVRNKCCNSEMPQAFKYNLILDAYSKCTQETFLCGTECLQIALDYGGVNAQLIMGPPSLFKVTYQEDIKKASEILQPQKTYAKILVCNDSRTFSSLGSHINDSSVLPVINDIVAQLLSTKMWLSLCSLGELCSASFNCSRFFVFIIPKNEDIGRCFEEFSGAFKYNSECCVTFFIVMQVFSKVSVDKIQCLNRLLFSKEKFLCRYVFLSVPFITAHFHDFCLLFDDFLLNNLSNLHGSVLFLGESGP